MAKRLRLLGDRAISPRKLDRAGLLKALQLAETYLEDGCPHSALRVIRKALGYSEDRPSNVLPPDKAVIDRVMAIAKNEVK